MGHQLGGAGHIATPAFIRWREAGAVLSVYAVRRYHITMAGDVSRVTLVLSSGSFSKITKSKTNLVADFLRMDSRNSLNTIAPEFTRRGPCGKLCCGGV